MKNIWQELVLPQDNEGLVWELFHENSKRGKYDECLSDDDVLARMGQLRDSLSFSGYPVVQLPSAVIPLDISLDKALGLRESCHKMISSVLTVEQVGTLLHYAYGETRSNDPGALPRTFRIVPSAGGLYPLEIFFHSAQIKGQSAGLYYFNPVKNQIRLIREGNAMALIAGSMVQSDVALGASLIMFIAAVFERSIFKYGDRGYRFILLEAGHIAQNINLVATALGLGVLNIGGFLDRHVDEFLGLDGLTMSTIYMVAIGNNPSPT